MAALLINLCQKVPQQDAGNAHTPYQAFWTMITHAAKQCVPRANRGIDKPRWNKECQALLQTTQTSTGTASNLTASSLITMLDNNRDTR